MTKLNLNHINSLTNIHAIHKSVSHLQHFRLFDYLLRPTTTFFQISNQDYHAQRHASLSRRSKCRSNNRLDRTCSIRILHLDSGVILGAQVGLDTFTILTPNLVNIFADLVRPHEGYRFDVGMGQDSIDCVLASVDNVYHAGG